METPTHTLAIDSHTTLAILSLASGLVKTCLTSGLDGEHTDVKTSPLHQTQQGRYYFIRYQKAYYIDQFRRII